MTKFVTAPGYRFAPAMNEPQKGDTCFLAGFPASGGLIFSKVEFLGKTKPGDIRNAGDMTFLEFEGPLLREGMSGGPFVCNADGSVAGIMSRGATVDGKTRGWAIPFKDFFQGVSSFFSSLPLPTPLP